MNVDSKVVEALLRRYRQHLIQERGLANATVLSYEEVARGFLREFGRGRALEEVTGAEIAGFVLKASRRRSRNWAKRVVTGLRSLLRFLHLEGWSGPPAEAVPAVAGWRGSHLPRGMGRGEVTRLLASCDLRTVTGRRDLAVLVLLARLGLRCNEVAQLNLADFDWRSGEVVIRGKGRRQERLPLPVDVGTAVEAYILGGRTQDAESRRLFQALAPASGDLTPSAVSGVVRRACRRAGLAPAGAHRLRHTVAMEMLRSGASLPEVGQVLRHRSLGTTAIYAKVDRDRLGELARPWPGGVA